MSDQEFQAQKQEAEDEAVAAHQLIVDLHNQILKAKKKRTEAFRQARDYGVPAGTLARRMDISGPMVTRILAGDR